ncbi:MAG: hypothetical protein ACTSRP_01540 [Candidatus Helarchaeota archaeon]
MPNKKVELLLNVILPYVFLLIVPFSLANENNAVFWMESAEYYYKVADGSANVRYLNTLKKGDIFKIILGGSADIHADKKWDELKIRFQKVNPAGEISDLVRPYLSLNSPNYSTPLDQITPPFFVWLLNESVRNKNGEVHDYFNDFEFNGAKYDKSVGFLIYFNGQENPELGLGDLIIEYQQNIILELPWYLKAFLGGMLSGIGGLIVNIIYKKVKKKRILKDKKENKENNIDKIQEN